MTTTDTTYAWIITKDYIEHTDNVEPKFVNGRFVKVTPPKFDTVDDLAGPRDADDAMIERLRAGEGIAFQLWDDDGILYYEGRFFEGDGYGDPLHDYGTPSAGCTEMTINNREDYIG